MGSSDAYPWPSVRVKRSGAEPNTNEKLPTSAFLVFTDYYAAKRILLSISKKRF